MKTVKSPTTLTKKIPKRLTNICNWDKIKYPVFTYKKQTHILNKEMQNISLLLEHIAKLQVIIENLQNTMKEDGNRLNIFINNSFHCKPKFDYNNHFLVLKNHTVEIHDNSEINTALVQNEIQFLRIEETEELYNLIPTNPKRTYKATKKQLSLCRQLSETYAEHYDEFTLYNEDLEAANDLHDRLLDVVADEVNNISVINMTPTGTAEQFDENIHDLVVIRVNNTLELFFIRKEYSNDFLQRINENVINENVINS